MKKFIASMALVLSATLSMQANAGLIDIELSTNNVAVGDTLSVSLWASNFTDFDSLYTEFEYDISLFSYQAASLQSELPAFDGFLTGLEVTEQFYGLSLSFLDFFAFSDLNLDADNKFLLASFDLLAIDSGNTDFSLVNQVAGLFDPNTGFDTPLDVDTSSPVQASATSVPEPSSLALFMLSALMFVGRRKQ